MGRGDKRTFKGKVFRHSFGKTRPRKKKKAAPATQKKK
jgi:30S ribosomal protein S31